MHLYHKVSIVKFTASTMYFSSVKCDINCACFESIILVKQIIKIMKYNFQIVKYPKKDLVNEREVGKFSCCKGAFVLNLDVNNSQHKYIINYQVLTYEIINQF